MLFSSYQPKKLYPVFDKVGSSLMILSSNSVIVIFSCVSTSVVLTSKFIVYCSILSHLEYKFVVLVIGCEKSNFSPLSKYQPKNFLVSVFSNVISEIVLF